MRSLSGERQYRCGRCGHAGAADHRRLGAFRGGEHAFDLFLIRIAEAGVELRMPRLTSASGEVFDRLGPEHRRLIDRCDHCRGPIQRAIGVDQPRLDGVFFLGHSEASFSTKAMVAPHTGFRR